MSKSVLIDNLYNEDGTSLMSDFPENPLKAKWDKLYPPCESFETLGSYNCMRCWRCPLGSGWRVPTEDEEQWKKYQEEVREYHRKHNPSMMAEVGLL